MNFLLVDNSNTRTKFTLSSREKLSDWHAIIPTSEISEHSLNSTLGEITWDAALISSVVPTKAKILSSLLEKYGPCHELNHQTTLPIGINYPNPEQIGADRLANAAAAFTYHGAPCVVLDFGTAVTFDVIALSTTGVHTPAEALAKTGATADDGASAQPMGGVQAYYQGGVIAPGLASMTEGLARRTALLPHIELDEPTRAIGQSTEEAMLSGAIHGYRGLVREILKQINQELPSPPTVVATGGDAALITRGLPEIKHHSAQLTLEGLRIIANLHFPNA